jgi:hypothetical protein
LAVEQGVVCDLEGRPPTTPLPLPIPVRAEDEIGAPGSLKNGPSESMIALPV